MKVSVKCSNCGEEILRYPEKIKRNKNNFCSVDCRKDLARKSVTPCGNCGKEIYKPPYHIKRSEKNFCDRSCWRAYFVKPELIKERFMSHIEIIDENTWLWKGSKGNKRYGQFSVGGKPVLAHRLSYEIFVGEIPEGYYVLHKYDDNPLNICPKNLWLGTQAENMIDKLEKGRGIRGEKIKSGKLTSDKVLEIRKLYSTGEYYQKDLAKIFNVSKGGIGLIVRRINWKHI